MPFCESIHVVERNSLWEHWNRKRSYFVRTSKSWWVVSMSEHSHLGEVPICLRIFVRIVLMRLIISQNPNLRVYLVALTMHTMLMNSLVPSTSTCLDEVHHTHDLGWFYESHLIGFQHHTHSSSLFLQQHHLYWTAVVIKIIPDIHPTPSASNKTDIKQTAPIAASAAVINTPAAHRNDLQCTIYLLTAKLSGTLPKLRGLTVDCVCRNSNHRCLKRSKWSRHLQRRHQAHSPRTP